MTGGLRPLIAKPNSLDHLGPLPSHRMLRMRLLAGDDNRVLERSQKPPVIVAAPGWSCNWKTPPGALTCTTLQSLAPNYSAVFTYSATVGKSLITFVNCAVIDNVNDTTTGNNSRCKSVVVK